MQNDNIKLNFIIVCDNALLDSNGKLNITGVFDTIGARGFPAVHNKMSIVVNMDMPEGIYIEVLKIKKGDLEITNTPQIEIKKDRPGRHQFIHHFVNTRFPEEGDYSVEVYINENLVVTTKLSLQLAR